MAFRAVYYYEYYPALPGLYARGSYRPISGGSDGSQEFLSIIHNLYMEFFFLLMYFLRWHSNTFCTHRRTSLVTLFLYK